MWHLQHYDIIFPNALSLGFRIPHWTHNQVMRNAVSACNGLLHADMQAVLKQAVHTNSPYSMWPVGKSDFTATPPTQ